MQYKTISYSNIYIMKLSFEDTHTHTHDMDKKSQRKP